MEDSSNSNDNRMRLSLTLTSSQSSPRVDIRIANTGTTSSMLRETISEETKIPLSALKLIFRGRLIANKDEGDVVVDYKLEDGCVIHCMGKPVLTNTTNNTNTNTTSNNEASTTTSTVSSGASVTMMNTTNTTSSNNAGVSSNNNNNASDFMGLLNVLKSNCSSPDAYLTAVTTLEKIVSNITSHPLEEKYRKVKKENPAFQRRLGSIVGSANVLKKLGFEEQTLNGGVVHYVLKPSPSAWPSLLQSHLQLKQAVQQAKSTTPTTPPTTIPPSGRTTMPPPPMMPGMPPMMPGMESHIQNLMSNPQQLQSMLQNPMVRSMLENDPQFANNPMLRQSIDTLSNNPQMLEQMTRMMADPGMRAQMNSMMSQRGIGGGMGMNNMGMGQPTPPSSTNTTTTTNNNNNNNSNNNNSGQGDRDTTEEEMIAEAIARSLREQ